MRKTLLAVSMRRMPIANIVKRNSSKKGSRVSAGEMPTDGGSFGWWDTDR